MIIKGLSGFLLAVLLLILTACNSSRSMPGDHKGSMVIFGEGGGFAGRETGYAILDNNEVFEMDHQRNYSRFKELDGNTTDQIFENIQLLRLAERPFMEPGNTYYFIEIHEKGEVTRLSWNDVTANAPADVRSFYKVLRRHVSMAD